MYRVQFTLMNHNVFVFEMNKTEYEKIMATPGDEEIVINGYLNKNDLTKKQDFYLNQQYICAKTITPFEIDQKNKVSGSRNSKDYEQFLRSGKVMVIRQTQ